MTRHPGRATFLFFVGSFVSLATLGSTRSPVAVSPSGRTAETCPTFSWSVVDGSRGYELVAYPVTDLGEIGEAPSLIESLPEGALSWTPPLGRCLEVNRTYVWWIGALETERHIAWSEPALIQVATAPSVTEVAEALAILERYLNTTAAEGGLTSESLESVLRRKWLTSRQSDALASSQSGLKTIDSEAWASSIGAPPLLGLPGASASGESLKHEPPSLIAEGVTRPAHATVLPAAALTVSGEVRAVGPTGSPRSWGRGRVDNGTWGVVGGPCTYGNLKYGLSTIMVDWGSAADACPIGTWVCHRDELDGDSCDTGVPDDGEEGWSCAGNPFDYVPDGHAGWTQGGWHILERGTTFSENGGFNGAETCVTLPVWCCWE